MNEHFEFRARVELLGEDSGFHIVYLPEAVVNELPLKKFPKLRVEGEISDVGFQLSLHPDGGRRYLILGKGLRKEAEIEFGDTIEVSFRIADQDHVEIPMELRDALAADSEFQQSWEQLSVGKRRSFAFQVSKAKQAETKERRIAEIAKSLKKAK